MRKFFFRGLMALLPTILTIFILYVVIGLLYRNVGIPLGDFLKWGVLSAAGKSEEELARGWILKWFFNQGAPLIGFVVGILLTFVAGFFMATFIGRSFVGLFDRIFARLPLVRVIYPYAKQFTTFFFSADKKMDFTHAVAVPFPTMGMYSIGFITGEGMKSLNDAVGRRLQCVYVPTAPTPLSGFVVYVAREDIVPLPITVEEAMRIVITAGVIHPAHQAVAPPGESQAALPPARTGGEKG